MENIESKEFPFEISIEDILRFLGPEARLYSDDSRVFIRELVQNAVDAIIVNSAVLTTRKNTKGDRSTLSFLPDFRRSLSGPYRGQVKVTFREDPQGKAVIVEDNGIGLDEAGMRHLVHPLRGIEHYIGEELDLETRSQVIGQFGAGLLSVFKVSDHIEIESKRFGQEACLLDVCIRHLAKPDEKGQKLVLDSRLRASKMANPGTRVTVYLESAFTETKQHILSVDTEKKVFETLTYFVRRMPPKIDLIYYTNKSSKPIKPQPFIGVNKKPRCELKIPGIIGYIAYDGGGSESTLTVCQRGILVKSNYLSLLPEGTLSIVGEIDLQTTSLLTLKPSREEIVEDKKLTQLKSELKAALEAFMDHEYKQWSEEKRTEDPKISKQEKLLSEKNSSEILNYINMYNSGNVTIMPQIERHVTFQVKTKNSPDGEEMLLGKVCDLCKQELKHKVYIYVQQAQFVDVLGKLEDSDIYEHRNFRDLHAQAIIENGEILIHLHEYGDEKVSMAPLVTKVIGDISGDQINVINLDKLYNTDNIIKDEELPESPDTGIRMISMTSASGRHVFRRTGGNTYSDRIRINSANAKVAQVLKKINRIRANKDLNLAYKAYINLLAGRFNEAVEELEKLLIGQDGK